MFSIETVVFISAIVLCVGALLGAIVSRTILPPSQHKGLEKQLSESREELEKYQQEVAQHFSDTSKLVSNLTESYKEVHDHLSKGAILLTNPNISQSMIDAGTEPASLPDDETMNHENVVPPRDYAPKAPGETGVLSEQFGLNETESTEDKPFDPSHIHRA